ncbi:MAG: DUF2911 domain-containing protein [Acidobacteria bacterium]|nr:DUF2911 domain-containing protein [Acidobacteriota bacterium]
MKKRSILAITLILCLMDTAAVFSQAANPRNTATLGGGRVTVEYGSPSSRGRDVLALIVPGSYWRMGADDNTTLDTQTDLRFGDETVPAGSYVLLAHFLEGENWELIISKGVQEGSRPKDTVAIVPYTLEKGHLPVERMKIELKEEMGKFTLILSWGEYTLSAEFSDAS